MSSQRIQSILSIFTSRLDTLGHLLVRAEETFKEASFLQRRLAPDMAPFGTQIAYTCNQPRNFALWAQGRPADNLDPDVVSIEQARIFVRETQALLAQVSSEDSKLAERTRIDLAPGLYAQMTGHEYVDDFLVPNFYFHLVTAYGILRMSGVAIGKRDYMQHLLPLVRQA
ncbi:hypothetical protein HNQ60_001793 [Povalibacter uvarum]|uniref:DUF1993 domain-containing protein n=1 Tax=Povalibacter uvarum TaxID=732238 RepID=A0A841HLQ8_9GAMM|nr:DUF1993 domain-containing protein [Povalibacter uvarum]MBB6092915.1 hypothetical protein [Povalibacter uvarum]